MPSSASGIDGPKYGESQEGERRAPSIQGVSRKRKRSHTPEAGPSGLPTTLKETLAYAQNMKRQEAAARAGEGSGQGAVEVIDLTGGDSPSTIYLSD